MKKAVNLKTEDPSILQPGRNCWRVEKADNASLIVDAERYFRELREALSRAQKQIIIVGWDFDTRIDLDTPGTSQNLGSFISDLVKNNKSLNIYILKWNVGALKILARGTMLFTVLRWMKSPQITLKLDSAHPAGASHHQKLIVIDGSMAFCGGIDVTCGRWDNPDHLDENPVRRNPDGKQYPPWHDMTLAVDGEAARALSDLARARWANASGRQLPAVHCPQPWVLQGQPDFQNLFVGISRTMGAYNGTEPLRENEALFIDLIASANEYVYVENQYFASSAIAKSIALRLADDDPPEIVLIMPETANGWLEQVAMDTARSKLCSYIARFDRRNRFRIYHPFTAQGTPIYVHAKLMIVDGKVLRVGSANMNNRSLGFDSECDLVVDARGQQGGHAIRDRIEDIRNSLLSEHLDVPPVKVAESLSSQSLIATIEDLRNQARSLRPFQFEESPEKAEDVSTESILDPLGKNEPSAERIRSARDWWIRRLLRRRPPASPAA